jgi:hypothetical protein
MQRQVKIGPAPGVQNAMDVKGVLSGFMVGLTWTALRWHGFCGREGLHALAQFGTLRSISSMAVRTNDDGFGRCSPRIHQMQAYGSMTVYN